MITPNPVTVNQVYVSTNEGCPSSLKDKVKDKDDVCLRTQMEVLVRQSLTTNPARAFIYPDWPPKNRKQTRDSLRKLRFLLSEDSRTSNNALKSNSNNCSWIIAATSSFLRKVYSRITSNFRKQP